MPVIAQLRVTDYKDENRWRWVLEDHRGKFLADHEVDLRDDASPEREAFRDLPGRLYYFRKIKTPAQILDPLGAWMGERVFGAVAAKLAAGLPRTTIVRVAVPDEAQALLTKPFELAHLPTKKGKKSLAEAGVRFIYHLEDAPESDEPKAKGDTFRVLAVFSLPHGENPLSLRRERVALEELIRNLAQTRGLALDLRVLQYGATRQILEDALEEAAGWDLIHISGHGHLSKKTLRGELLLEDENGKPDRIDDQALAELLEPAYERLHLLTLSTCLSGAGTVRAARRQIGLDPPRREAGRATREPVATEAETPAVTEEEETEALAEGLPLGAPLPSLGQSLAQELDCAVLAMRYSVGDDFARKMVRALYEKLLGKGQSLPAALQLALDDVLEGDQEASNAFPLSRITPILFGPRAAELVLEAPDRKGPFVLPDTGLLGFPDPPPRFVGRVRPMLWASAALAPDSPHRGVLFHGMAGGGKTACALELAYRHERGRFRVFIWWEAPKEAKDQASDDSEEKALTDFAEKLETRLPGLALGGLLDDPKQVRLTVVPRLRGLLQQNAILLVLDNLESLLTSSDGWRDERWGDVVSALLDHNGTSRVVLTSRRVPADLTDHPHLQRESIHALSFPESVLLARELSALSKLFATPEGRQRLQSVLNAAQGHPKLLELAEGAAQRGVEDLDRLVGGSSDDDARAARRFFTEGETERDVAAFVEELERWTTGLSAGLPPTARLLFHCLCCLEEEDRISGIVEVVWPHLLKRLAASAPGEDLDAALERLAASGLVEAERLPQPEEEAAAGDGSPRLLRLHPAVAEAGRKEAGNDVAAAVDRELGDFWVALFYQALETEMQGTGGMVATAGLRAAPYLMRAERWEEANGLLEQTLGRASTPPKVAAALSLLRRKAQATEGTERELLDASVLVNTLIQTGRLEEAETRLRELIERAERQGAFRLASEVAATLFNLLLATGRAEEALGLAERKADFTRRAGLGPWTQLLDEWMRLQPLNALGRYQEVLGEVERLRARMEALPDKSEAEEAVNPWNVREGLLDISHTAALYLEDWQAALELNAETLRNQIDRGAGEVELARTRFNDYGPLLRLGRFAEARSLLEACRRTFEAAGQLGLLSKALSALADLEDKLGNREAAAGFEQVALRYKYQAGEPEGCAISHNNLANYLGSSAAPAEGILAHRLAAGAILFQTSSGLLGQLLYNLARSPLPPEPPTFDEVATQVEQIEGVRFRDLFERLPRKAPDGDAAIAEVWRLVGGMRAAMQAEREKDALAAAPEAVRQAIEANDNEALRAALASLPEDEAVRVFESLQDVGVLGSG